MSTATYIATKTASSIATRVRPHVINWFLNKYFPLAPTKYVVDFLMVPIIRLNHASLDYSIQVGFSLRSYDWYEVEIHSARCTVVVDGMLVAVLKDEQVLTLKPGGPMLNFSLFGQLSQGDAKRLDTAFKEQRVKVVRCGFQFSTKTRFGTGTPDLLEKAYCLQLEKYA